MIKEMTRKLLTDEEVREGDWINWCLPNAWTRISKSSEYIGERTGSIKFPEKSGSDTGKVIQFRRDLEQWQLFNSLIQRHFYH